MPRYMCVKPTTFRGRQIQEGAGFTVNDKIANTFEGNECWKCLDKKTKPSKPPERPKAPEAPQETERQRLLGVARELGLKPNARTGAKKLTDMIEQAKRAKTEGQTGSVV